MKFKNIAAVTVNGQTSGLPLSFDCGEQHYDVAAWATFEVPDEFAYAIEKMGVQAERVGSEGEAAALVEPEAVSEPRSKKNR